MGAAGLLDHGLQSRGVGGDGRQGDVDVGRPERLLPVLGAALPTIPQLRGAGGHALPELGREAVERGLRHPQRLEALVREGRGDPGVAGRIGGRSSRIDEAVQPPDKLAARGTIVDTQQQVGADVGRRALVERPALDVVELQADALRRGHGCVLAIGQ